MKGTNNPTVKKRTMKMPHPFVLIILLLILITILTYIIPSGQYQRIVDEETGRTLVDPNTFEYIEQTPVSPFGFVQSIPIGMNEAAWVMILIFMVGGSFGIINATGAIESALNASIDLMKGKDKLLLAGLMAIFSLGGATFGMAESTLIFIPIGVMLAQALGYDKLVGMAVVNLGASIGFASGWMNIYTVGVAQGIAEVPLFSGMGFRIISHVILLSIGIAYVFWYANRIKKDPTKSILYGTTGEVGTEKIQAEIPPFDGKRKRVMFVVLVGFIILIYGITSGWSTGTQISALFLVMGVVAGYAGGMTTTQIADAFAEGARGLVFGALLVGLCRALVVVMTEGNIIDTILYAVSNALSGTNNVVGAGMMTLLQSFINFLLNSGSGQAAATMPIMAPLADVLGVSRQTAVLAFQYGDGLSNSLWPTSGVLLAGLSIAGISYEKWIKFVLKLMIILHVVVIGLTMISVVIGYN